MITEKSAHTGNTDASWLTERIGGFVYEESSGTDTFIVAFSSWYASGLLVTIIVPCLASVIRS